MRIAALLAASMFASSALAGAPTSSGPSFNAAAPPPIGSTTPNTGAFTTLATSGAYTASGTVRINSSNFGFSSNFVATGETVIANILGIGPRNDLDTNDAFLSAPAAAVLQIGKSDAASPVAQTFQAQSVLAGTSNTAGVNTIFASSKGTGTGAGGSILLQTAPAGTTGTAQNALATAVTIAPTKLVTLAGALALGGSAPTLTGTCTTASQVGGNTAGTFTATCVAQTVIITFATTAPNGWICFANDRTTPTDTLGQTASSTTSCTLTGTTVALDAVGFMAVAY